MFYSAKGYRVSLPADGWQVERGGRADLELKREGRPGGMLADATCEGREPGRPLDVLARHLTFGLTKRQLVESGTAMVAGRAATHTVVRGSAEGREVAVEAVVAKDGTCVYDFLYVAPVDAFESGREDFRTFVESFSLRE